MLRWTCIRKVIRKSRKSRQKVRCRKYGNFLKDQISELPDEILIHILSSLTMKEATRTSLLSKRWENLWKFSCGNFNFNRSELFTDARLYQGLTKEERDKKYMGWVDQVLNSHQGPTIDELSINYGLDKRYEAYVNKWIGIALNKRVKHLKLSSAFNIFPQEYFSPISPSSGVKYLISLSLNHLIVIDDMVENILLSCPLLEKIDISWSSSLRNLKVSNSSLRLKQFHLTFCGHIKSIEIFVPNIVSFECNYAGIEEVNIRYAPQLRDVGYTMKIVKYTMTYDFTPLSSCLSQIVSLTLYLHINELNLKFPKFSELTNLRHLTYVVIGVKRRSLLGLTSLIEALPFLQKFTMKLFWLQPIKRRKRLSEIMKSVSCINPTSQHLKEVKIVGFAGSTIDTEFLIYLLKKAINLEKIVIDTYDPLMADTPSERRHLYKQRAKALKFAARLLKNQPQTCQVVII